MHAIFIASRVVVVVAHIPSVGCSAMTGSSADGSARMGTSSSVVLVVVEQERARNISWDSNKLTNSLWSLIAWMGRGDDGMLGAGGVVVVALVVTHTLANANRKNSRNLLNVIIIIIFMLNRNGTFFAQTNICVCLASLLSGFQGFAKGGSRIGSEMIQRVNLWLMEPIFWNVFHGPVQSTPVSRAPWTVWIYNYPGSAGSIFESKLLWDLNNLCNFDNSYRIGVPSFRKNETWLVWRLQYFMVVIYCISRLLF